MSKIPLNRVKIDMDEADLSLRIIVNGTDIAPMIDSWKLDVTGDCRSSDQPREARLTVTYPVMLP